jgi:cyclic beta-1,2-glucan synthetase
VAAFAELGNGEKAGELYGLINPINLAGSRAGVQRYRGEPYVMAADVYSEPHHVGQAGWTWYTGSAGWMYRVGLEWILGIHVAGSRLIVDPCIPPMWPGFEVMLRHGTARYTIVVENPYGVSRGVIAAELDGKVLRGKHPVIRLLDDGASHRVRVVMGERAVGPGKTRGRATPGQSAVRGAPPGRSTADQARAPGSDRDGLGRTASERPGRRAARGR